MSIFDLFKRREDAHRDLESLPSMKRPARAVEFDLTCKRVADLQAVGREADASRAISDYLEGLFQEWKKEPDNSVCLRLLCTAAKKFGALEKAKDYFYKVIQANEVTPIVDLTVVYYDLGGIYHKLSGTTEKEFWCFRMATEAVPPKNCKFPATKKEKAKAHHFAFTCMRAGHFGTEEEARYHDRKRRELAPEIDFDDFKQWVKWLAG